MTVSCQGPYGADGAPGDRADRADCGDPARFEVARHGSAPLRVCPVHLGPALLLAAGVRWPPGVSLIG
ncbi:hypothetical protein AB0G32_17625 [Streptomyces sp. NPDC023723]|uniref:hypothetical protein n=1 Tax=Streptomyces sp. NPDC023723 TaxID=3154323 RepID=UPI00340A9584